MSSHEDRLRSVFTTMAEELSLINANTVEKQFAVDRLVQRMRKRACLNGQSLTEVAIQSFLDSNERVRNCTLTLDEKIIANSRYYLTVVLERYTKSFSETAIQQPLETSFLFDHWRFGPGSSNGVQGTHTAQKIVQRMTCTPLCEPFVRRLRRTNPYFRLNDERNKDEGLSYVEGSRLSTVPKNEDTERTIAIEPSGNMALQLAAGRYLENTLRYIGLDISTQQPKNKAMARRGSIDNSIATIDLKAASDMISIELVRLLMPPEWFDLLMKIRSQTIQLPGGNKVEMYMISTMGNGFTFPLMTLLLTSLIYGFRATRGGPNLRVDWSNTCIFGDDIILPRNEYGAFCEVLVAAGLIVNYDKSYSDGPFRESCGGDYYSGYDVTPFYIQSLRTPSDIYVAINQVLEWCGKNNIFLHQTLVQLRCYLNAKVFLVPEWLNPDQGIRTILVSRRYSYLKPNIKRKKLVSSIYDCMLAVGGYITESGSDQFFVPRVKNPRYKVRKSRLPKGYLDGWDPISRDRLTSVVISTFVDVIFR